MEEIMKYAQAKAQIIMERPSYQGSKTSIFMLYLLLHQLNWIPVTMQKQCIVCELQKGKLLLL